jgi:hypothetical protein
VRWLVERRTGAEAGSDLSSGTLFSSGLIAGGSLAGILFAVLVGTGTVGPFQAIGNALAFLHEENAVGHAAGALLFAALGVILYRAGQRRVA